MVNFPAVPKEVKPLAHLLKLAKDHDSTDSIVVAYWARMSACLLASRLVPGAKSPETEELIDQILDWLEETKKANEDNEGITDEATAQILMEEYAFKMFEYGDEHDKAQIFNKQMVKSFYTAGVLMDVLEELFGTLPEDMKQKRQYAKLKAVHIYYSLKAGVAPLPGPPTGINDHCNGIVHNGTLSKEELVTDKKYTEPIPFNRDEIDKLSADKPVSPNTVPNKSFGLDMPKTGNANNSASVLASSLMNDNKQVTPEEFQKAQMYCEFVTSALKHNDVKSAVESLHKALNFLQIGGDCLDNKM